MPYNGSGTFTRVHNFASDRDAGIKIDADRMDAEIDGIATGLSTALTKDGQTTATGDLPMGTNKITGLGNPTAAQDAATKTYTDSTAANAVGDSDGSLTSGGSSNAYTLTSNAALDSLSTGDYRAFKANHSSDGAATLNIDSQGAKKWFWEDGTTQMDDGDVIAGRIYHVEYDETLDSSAGGWKNRADILLPARARIEASAGSTTTAVVGDHGTLFKIDVSSSHDVLTLPADTAVYEGWYVDVYFQNASNGFQENYIGSVNGTDTDLHYRGDIAKHYVLGGEMWRCWFRDGKFNMILLRDTEHAYKAKLTGTTASYINLTSSVWEATELDTESGTNNAAFDVDTGNYDITVPVDGNYQLMSIAEVRNNASKKNTWVHAVGQDTSNPYVPNQVSVDWRAPGHPNSRTWALPASEFLSGGQALQQLLYCVEATGGDGEKYPSLCSLEITWKGR